MAAKISIGLSALVLCVTVVLFVQQRSAAESVLTLSERVGELEEQNSQLFSQVETVQNMVNDVSAQQQQRSSARMDDPEADSSIVSGGYDETSGIKVLKEDLKEELSTLLEQKQSDERAKRQEEREKQWQEGMSLSLKDFGDDHELDEDVVAQLQVVLEQSFNQRSELRKEMEAQNLSFYEFQQERRRQAEAMEETLSDLLTEKQFQAFTDAFPTGGRRRAPGPR